MSAGAVLALLVLGGGIGLLIGGVGVGGVLLVPALTYLGGIGIQVAIAAAMFSYLFTGLVGTVLYAREGSIDWPLVTGLVLGAMPAAFAGAWAANIFPPELLKLLIAGFIAFAGVNSLRRQGRQAPARTRLSGGALAAIGVVTGFCSALTGTGGPLVLVPLLVWLRMPVLVAIGLSQAIQFPIAFLATAGNLVYGEVDFLLGGILACALIVGVVIGAKAAHRLPQRTLQRIVAWMLIGVAAFMLVNLGLAWSRA